MVRLVESFNWVVIRASWGMLPWILTGFVGGSKAGRSGGVNRSHERIDSDGIPGDGPLRSRNAAAEISCLSALTSLLLTLF